MLIIIESEVDKAIYEGCKLTKEDRLANEDLYRDFGGYEDK